MSGTDVSVVIPTRGRWRTLSRTLAGALGQTGVNHEVVVVDDCSTDETARQLAELGDRRVRVVRRDARRNQAAARNAGIAAAAGAWLAFLDDDDLWAPHKLRALLDAAAERDAVLAYSGALVVNEENTVVETWAAPSAEGLLELLLRGNWIPAGASNVVARTDVIRDLGGFDEELSHFTDWDMWIRLAAAGSAAASSEHLVAYVLHPENFLLTEPRGAVGEFGRFTGKHRRLAATYGVAPERVLPDPMGVLRWLGSGHARAGRRLTAAGCYLRAARRRSPYGRRRTLRDALLALGGTVPLDREPAIDGEALRTAAWLDDLPS